MNRETARNLQKLNPWNWFKHEEGSTPVGEKLSVRKNDGFGRSYFPLADFHRDIDRLFESAFRDFGMPSLFEGSLWSGDTFFRPQVDISGNDKAYEIKLDVPGMKQSELNIEVQGDSLVLTGEKQESVDRKEKEFYRAERRYGTFQRILALPEDANTDDMKADLNEGVLTLTIPRKQLAQTKAKHIDIH